MTSVVSPLSRIHGCLLGGAVAEGVASAGVSSVAATGSTPSDDGVIHLGPAGQLSLYTADALVEVLEWANAGIFADPAACVWLAFLRWAKGQRIPLHSSAPPAPQRSIDSEPAVRRQLAERPHWSSSLEDSEMGTPARPLGASYDDAAAAARSAPFGLIVGTPPEAVATMAVDGASLTHGGAAAIQAAAAVALAIRGVVAGDSVRDAVAAARGSLASTRGGTPDVLAAMDAAMGRASANEESAAARAVREAFSAALEAEDEASQGSDASEAFTSAITRAAKGGPDVAAVTGALLGARWGVDAVPSRLAHRLEGAELVAQLARALASASGAD